MFVGSGQLFGTAGKYRTRLENSWDEKMGSYSRVIRRVSTSQESRLACSIEVSCCEYVVAYIRLI